MWEVDVEVSITIFFRQDVLLSDFNLLMQTDV
jgi:hypothetical protein